MDDRLDLGRYAKPGDAANAVVVKKLASGVAGTQRLASRFGTALVCVRYREDASNNLRYTTVELVVDERPAKPSIAPIRIGYQESALRRKIMEAGEIGMPGPSSGTCQKPPSGA